MFAGVVVVQAFCLYCGRTDGHVGMFPGVQNSDDRRESVRKRMFVQVHEIVRTVRDVRGGVMAVFLVVLACHSGVVGTCSVIVFMAMRLSEKIDKMPHGVLELDIAMGQPMRVLVLSG